MPAATALFALFFTGQLFAQNTTSSLRVDVTDGSGTPLSGVPVSVRHIPTGRTQIVTTNPSGSVSLRGLRVGGPYEVSLAGDSGYNAPAVQDIYLRLDETEVVPITAQTAQIEEIVVSAQQVTQEVAVGVSRSFDRAAIDATPTISRDFTATLARDPKILVDNSVARGPAVSMAGQNFRFNSVTIDGIAQNDNFGLNRNASATSRTPISIDAIEAITVNIAPFDVTYGGFVGGNINIVTKSGTNEFEGSAFYFMTDESLSGDESDGASVDIADFDEETIGFTLGGPIIKDKVFFFANYEKFETNVPANAQPIEAISGVTQADIDQVATILQSEYGFDPGEFATTDLDEDEKRLLKIDWDINDDHRATFTYQFAKTDVLFDDFPTSAAFNSNRYNINQEMNAYSVQVFSNWTDNLSTEFKFGVKDVERRDRSVDGTTNEFLITAPGGGLILAGGDRFRHSNELDNESDIFRLKADYVVGDHTITAGWERESKTVRNRFLPHSKGLVAFDSIDNLQTRTINAGSSLYGFANTGNATDAEANFTLDNDSFFIQDTWDVNDDFILTYGLRYLTLSNSDPITDNPNFEARHGFSNGFNMDGADLLQPRVGFNWVVNDRLTLRGGAGLFGGGEPLIILSNAYSGDGISRTFAFPLSFMDPAAVAAFVADLPDADAAFNNLQSQIGVDPGGTTDVIDPSYKPLSTWKYSIGAEYVFGDDWIINADLIFSQVEDGYDIEELRRQVVDTAPDGRPIYDSPGFGFGYDTNVFNTSEGDGTVFTVSVAKSFDTDYGFWDLSLGYTRTDREELRSYNRFVTFETLVFDANIDHNNPIAGPSRFEVRDRVTATLNWQHELFGDNTTSVGLVYAGRTGRHFSYVFGSQGICTFGGIAFADCGAEGDIVGNQLLYVPTGPSDPLISGDPTFLGHLDEFIESESCLAGARGSIVTRNNCETDWVNVFSIRLQQEIKLGRTAFDVMLDIENVGNLLNSDWGRVDSYTAPSMVAPVNVSIPVAGGPYLYEPGLSYDPTVGAASVIPSPEIASLPSVYRIQLGVRFRF